MLGSLVGCAPQGTVALSPDGKRVAAIWPIGDEVKLAIGSQNGSDWRPVADINIDGGLSWSPNGRWLTVQTSNGVRLFDLKLGRFRGSFGPGSSVPVAWRPDTGQVAYIAHTPDAAGTAVVTYSLADQRETGRTTIGKVDPISALWIPRNDGQALLDDRGNVWAVEQGEVRRVTTTGDVVGIGLSADGQDLVWARKGLSPKQTLLTVWAYHLERRSVRRLPFADRVPGTLAGDGSAPQQIRVQWGPGSQRLVLVAQYASQRSRALAVSADGRTSRELTTLKGFIDAAWSADGSRFALMTIEDQVARVATYAADGTDGQVVGSKTWRPKR